MACLGLFLYFLLPWATPLPPLLLRGFDNSPKILDCHGMLLESHTRSDFMRRSFVAPKDIPKDIILATLCAEDARFYQHHGIDFYALLRVFYQRIQYGNWLSGGSTISQQCLKIASGSPPRTLLQKMREMLGARHLEMCFNKDAILSFYLNSLFYSPKTQGIKEAARAFFNQELQSLSLAQCALLAGLPQAPSRLNPFTHPTRALTRRNWILQRIAHLYPEQSQRVKRALKEPLCLQPPTYNLPTLPVDFSFLSREKTLLTTLDAPLQKRVQELLISHISSLKKRHINHGAAIVIENATGNILALVGSPFAYRKRPGDLLDATRIPRSPGSTLKPFLYLLAFEKKGLHPASILPDIPTTFSDILGKKSFHNYDFSYRGPVTLAEALGSSLNIPAVRTLNTFASIKPFVLFLQSLGLGSLQTAHHYGLGIALGGCEVSLIELAEAYASLARGGLYLPSRLLVKNDQPLPKRIAQTSHCFLIASILASNEARSMAFGIDSPLKMPFPCAVKTGTSTDFKDNWTLGFTKDFTVGVWVGNLDASPTKKSTGTRGASPLFAAIMHLLHEKNPPRWFTLPKGIIQASIHPQSGKSLLPHDPHAIHLFVEAKHCPPLLKESDFTTQGKLLLPELYASWVKSLGKHAPFAIYQTPQATLPFPRIISPRKNGIYLLDADLPHQGTYLTLQTDPPRSCLWSSPTLTITQENAQVSPILHLREGTHQVSAHFKERTKTITITVKKL